MNTFSAPNPLGPPKDVLPVPMPPLLQRLLGTTPAPTPAAQPSASPQGKPPAPQDHLDHKPPPAGKKATTAGEAALRAPQARPKTPSAASGKAGLPPTPAADFVDDAAHATAVVADPSQPWETREEAVLNFLAEHGHDHAALTHFLCPPDPRRAPTVLLAHGLKREPNANNVQATNRLFGALLAAINKVTENVTKADHDASLKPMLGRTADALLEAHHLFVDMAHMLPPGLAQQLNVSHALAMLMETGARTEFRLWSSNYLQLFRTTRTPIQIAVDMTDKVFAAPNLGNLRVDQLDQTFPDLHHALTVLRCETAVTCLAERAGLTLKIGDWRGRENTERFLEDVLHQAKEQWRKPGHSLAADHALRTFIDLIGDLLDTPDSPASEVQAAPTSRDANRLALLQQHEAAGILT